MKILIVILFFFLKLTAYSQWKEIETIPMPYADNYWLDVYFFESDPNYGWICGYNGYTLRTTDGGDTWQGSQVGRQVIDSVIILEQTIYDTTFVPINAQLESIHFANSSIGYTSGSDMIFKSEDGGKTWNRIFQNKRVWGNFFISPDVGVAVGGGCSNESLQFHRTQDGGITWNTFVNSTENSGLTDAMLYEANGIGYAVSSGIIWRTDNGGRTWYILSVTGGIDWQEEITNIGNSFLLPYSTGCNGNSGTPEEGGGLRMSVDYGKTWIQFHNGKPMFGTFLLDTLRGWGCGWGAEVYYTSNGGLDWELRNCGIKLNSSMDDIWFINDSLGWLVGEGVYRTFYYDTTKAQINSNGNYKICYNEAIILESQTSHLNYRWNTGDTTKSILVDKPGKYILEVFDSFCEFRISDTIDIKYYPATDLILSLDSSPDICEGDSIILWVENIYKDIVWSTNETNDTIIVKQAGEYYVTITDTNGCKVSKLINVNVHPLPLADIVALRDTLFCIGDSTKLTTGMPNNSYAWYETNDPEKILSKEREITIYRSGYYSVIVLNEFGCADTSEAIKIEAIDLTNALNITANNDNNILYFDTLGLTKSKCLELDVYNLGDMPVNITEIFIIRNIEFSIPQSQFPIHILPGDMAQVTVCFRPLDFNIRRDTLIFNDTCSDHNIAVFGYGKDNLYQGESDCDVNLKFRTGGLISGDYFSINNIHPNPAEDIINIDFNNSEDTGIYWTISNYLGEKVMEGDLQNNRSTTHGDTKLNHSTTRILTRGLQSGLYIIHISNGIQNQSSPIMIVR